MLVESDKGLNPSSRLIVDKSMRITMKVTASIGCIPVIAVFQMDSRGQPTKKLVVENAVACSSLREWKSVTSVYCNLSPGLYLVSYGLKETNNGYLQVKLFGSSMIKLIYRV